MRPQLVLEDKQRGLIHLGVRNGIVVSALGSEPERYLGLTEDQARHLARYGNVTR